MQPLWRTQQVGAGGKGGCVTTESIVMRASTGPVRRVSTEYRKPL